MGEEKKPSKKHKNFELIILKCFFLSLICVVNPVICVAHTHLLVTRVGPCYDSSKLVVSVSEMALLRDGYDSSLIGQVNITEDVDNGWSVRATVQKCHDIRNLDTCDFVKTFAVVPSGCDQSNEEDNNVMLFNYVEPKLDCPLQAGNYLIKEFPVFTEDKDMKAAESKISTSVFGYWYRLEGFDKEEERILCLDAYLQLIHLRKNELVLNKEHNRKTTPTVSTSDDTHEDDEDAQNTEQTDDNVSDER